MHFMNMKAAVAMSYLANVSKENSVASEDDGLLVEHVKLLGNGSSDKARAENGSASLGNESRLRGELVDELGRLLARRLRGHGAAVYGGFRMYRSTHIITKRKHI